MSVHRKIRKGSLLVYFGHYDEIVRPNKQYEYPDVNELFPTLINLWKSLQSLEDVVEGEKT